MEKVRFGFCWPEYSGSPLEVVHIFRPEYLFRPKFAVPFFSDKLVLCRNLVGDSEKEFKTTKEPFLLVGPV